MRYGTSIIRTSKLKGKRIFCELFLIPLKICDYENQTQQGT